MSKPKHDPTINKNGIRILSRKLVRRPAFYWDGREQKPCTVTVAAPDSNR